VETVKVVHTPGRAGVSVRVAHGVQGITVEVEVERTREEGESYEAAADHAADLAAAAYEQAVERLAALGLRPGKS